jgi:hypothetical protein
MEAACNKRSRATLEIQIRDQSTILQQLRNTVSEVHICVAHDKIISTGVTTSTSLVQGVTMLKD